MIVDLDTLSDGEIDADICIVGAGPAGISLASALGRSDLRICLVESGGLDVEDETQELLDGDSAGHLVATQASRARAFGGTSLLWTGRCAQLDPEDFEQRASTPRSGWPLSLEALEPYYLQARAYCGFKQPWMDDADALAVAPKIPVPALNEAQVNYFVWRYAVANGRSAVNLGKERRREFETSKSARVLLHATVTDYEVSENRTRVEAVVVRSLRGGRARIRARAFALCCGGIANAAMLLDAARSTGAAFGGPQTGRFFQQHPRGPIAHMLSNPEQSLRLQNMVNIFSARHGVRHEIGWALSKTVRSQEGLLNASAVPVYHADPSSGWEAAKAVLKGLAKRQVAPDLIAKLKSVVLDAESIAQNAFRRAGLGNPVRKTTSIDLVVDLEQAPDPESRITLSDRADALGKPLPKVDWRISEAERHTALRFATLLKGELERLDLGRVVVADWLKSSTSLFDAPVVETYHHIGATRMSTSPADGVVDPDCKVHGLENLYIGGSSVFPTGGHANPTLTIVALSLRLADHLRAKLGSQGAGPEVASDALVR